MEDSIITITQSLVKSYPMRDARGVDFTKNNQIWEPILKNNKVLPPIEIIGEFRDTLEGLLRGKVLTYAYCKEMIAQVKTGK